MKGIFFIKRTNKGFILDVNFRESIKCTKKAGVSFCGKFYGKDCGLYWYTVPETGGVMVCDEVRLAAEIQVIKQYKLDDHG